MTLISGCVLLHAIATGQTPSSQWPVYGLGVAALIYLILRPKMRRKKDPLDEARPSIGLAQQRSVEREMSNLLLELSEMARQVTAQLDTRSAKLEALIDEADRRLAELRRWSHTPAAAHSPSGPIEDPADPDSQQPTSDERYVEVYHLADEGRSPLEIAQQLSRPRGEVELILALRR